MAPIVDGYFTGILNAITYFDEVEAVIAANPYTFTIA